MTLKVDKKDFFDPMSDIEQYIKNIEAIGFIDPNCKTCQETFYPQIRMGKMASNIHAPAHVAKLSCKSGRRPHCTCDTCF